MKSVVIAGYSRSPFHFANKGALAKVRPDDLAAFVVRDLISKTGVNPDDIEDLICGCSFPEGEQGFNLARIMVFLSGLPSTVGGVTVNRFCGSSMQAVHQAAGAIAMGAGEAFICAGVESMTRVPIMGFNPLPNPTLYHDNANAFMGMGETAEVVAQQYDISRDAQEKFAVASHEKAAKAQAEGRFDDEIVPINGVERDGCIREGTTQDDLSGLNPAFDKDGSVTAGTSSPLTDGAAAVLVCSEDYAKAHNIEALARIKSVAISGCAPEVMGMGPVGSTRKALARAGLSLEDLDVVELNEAFSSQSLACINELGLDPAKINLDGGALALGHPLGATGARIVGKVASVLKREGAKYGLATQCIGGGQGIATIVEAI
ncbi:3-ketoacyl-CoA thiolase [Candidatus Terasakiella magnetica]|uniref:3-ketoacyl-CoA thiolase n=1 Tax=Candidatus Terasakiella magnetica TaxID=1867952 RepID=A0A1C3RBX2_9PROT|nr:thiolase family protein [Candidatus Terasakiella magnetica]SCA54760.1 3-ketoacyl-CoA thiolase [Candidatus Terasakiella magnetica]